jgi:hypothetical protein
VHVAENLQLCYAIQSMSTLKRVTTMDSNERKALVIKHAQLVAAFVSGNKTVGEELREIEEKLNLAPEEIAQLAVKEYLSEY